MRKFWLLGFVALAIGGGGWLFDHYSLDDLKALKFLGRKSNSSAADNGPGGESKHPLRIAAYKIRAFSLATLERHAARAVLAQATRNFDVLVITDIDPRGVEAVASLVDSANEGDRRFDSIVGPAVGRESRRMAIVFDADRVEVDRAASYVVSDPDHLLDYPPLIGWFRARGVPADEAFTFTVMAVDCQLSEFDAIGAAYRAVRDDGRGEDDVIVAGNFAASDKQLQPLAESDRLAAAIRGIPTNIPGDRQNANVLYSATASEFTGRAGVMDVVRQFNLTVEQALAISDEMPVWAEFFETERDRDGLAARGDRFGAGPLPKPTSESRAAIIARGRYPLARRRGGHGLRQAWLAQARPLRRALAAARP